MRRLQGDSRACCLATCATYVCSGPLVSDADQAELGTDLKPFSVFRKGVQQATRDSNAQDASRTMAKEEAPQYRYTSSSSSTAQGGGGSFKNRKPIGKLGCCESGMAERSH